MCPTIQPDFCVYSGGKRKPLLRSLSNVCLINGAFGSLSFFFFLIPSPPCSLSSKYVHLTHMTSLWFKYKISYKQHPDTWHGMCEQVSWRQTGVRTRWRAMTCCLGRKCQVSRRPRGGGWAPWKRLNLKTWFWIWRPGFEYRLYDFRQFTPTLPALQCCRIKIKMRTVDMRLHCEMKHPIDLCVCFCFALLSRV